MMTMVRLCQWRMACLCAKPQRGVFGGQPVDHVNGQADELVGQHAAAAETRSAVVVVGDGDAGAGADVVVGFEVEVADGAGVVMALQIAADLVVAIAEAVGKQAALGVQQQARRLDGAGRDDDDVGRAAPADGRVASK